MNLTWDGPSQPTRANPQLRGVNERGLRGGSCSGSTGSQVVPDTSWYDVEVGAFVHRCLALTGDLIDSDSLNISVGEGIGSSVQTQLVALVDGDGLNTTVDEVPDRVCLEGLDPLVFDASMASITLNNDTFTPVLPPRGRWWPMCRKMGGSHPSRRRAFVGGSAR